MSYSLSDDGEYVEEFVEREQEFIYEVDIVEFPAVVGSRLMVSSYAQYRQEDLIWIDNHCVINTMEEAEDLYSNLTKDLTANIVMPEIKYRILMFACEDVMQCINKDSEEYYEIMYTFKDRYLNMYASIGTLARVRYDIYDVGMRLALSFCLVTFVMYIFDFIFLLKIARDKFEERRRKS